MQRQGIGIIGTGWGVRVQLPAFRAAGLEIVALAGRQREKTRRIAYHHDVPYATDDWRTLIDHDAVGLVCVATPPRLHCEMSLAALEAGKHVLCEKPMALNTPQAEAMVATACARPQQLALVDHELRFLPALRKGRQLIAQGSIGTFRRAEVRAITSMRTDRQQPWDWWSDARESGGALATVSTHQVDMLRYLLNADVVSARGSLTTFITERPVGEPGISTQASGRMRGVTSDDFADFYLNLSNGGVALVTASLVAQYDEPHSIMIYGDRGTLQYSNGHLFYARGPFSKEYLDDITPPHSLSFPEGFTGHTYADYMQATLYLGHALRAALNGDMAAMQPSATFADGLHVQRVIDAVRLSSTYASDLVAIDTTRDPDQH